MELIQLIFDNRFDFRYFARQEEIGVFKFFDQGIYGMCCFEQAVSKEL